MESIYEVPAPETQDLPEATTQTTQIDEQFSGLVELTSEDSYGQCGLDGVCH